MRPAHQTKQHQRSQRSLSNQVLQGFFNDCPALGQLNNRAADLRHIHHLGQRTGNITPADGGVGQRQTRINQASLSVADISSASELASSTGISLITIPSIG